MLPETLGVNACVTSCSALSALVIARCTCCNVMINYHGYGDHMIKFWQINGVCYMLLAGVLDSLLWILHQTIAVFVFVFGTNRIDKQENSEA